MAIAKESHAPELELALASITDASVHRFFPGKSAMLAKLGPRLNRCSETARRISELARPWWRRVWRWGELELGIGHRYHPRPRVGWRP